MVTGVSVRTPRSHIMKKQEAKSEQEVGASYKTSWPTPSDSVSPGVYNVPMQHHIMGTKCVNMFACGSFHVFLT